jgi:signal peptidase II
MKQRFWASGLRWLLITLVVLLLDQFTKLWAVEALAGGNIIEVLPHFDLKLAFNYGAAFSFLANAGGWQQWALSLFAAVVSLVLIIWLSRINAQERWLGIALALVLSGAVGNLIDRLTYGYVIDFIDWYVSKNGYHWPTFNIADCAISIGAVMLLLESFLPFGKGQRSSSRANNKAGNHE